jgi:hypothetical protein
MLAVAILRRIPVKHFVLGPPAKLPSGAELAAPDHSRLHVIRHYFR